MGYLIHAHYGMGLVCRHVVIIADRTILVNGVAKTYAMTGWRLGWMVGPKVAITAS